MNKIDIINTFPYDTRWEDFINWVYDKKKSDLNYLLTNSKCIISMYLNLKCSCKSSEHTIIGANIFHHKRLIETISKNRFELSRLTSLKLMDFDPYTEDYTREDFIKALKLAIKELKEKGVL